MSNPLLKPIRHHILNHSNWCSPHPMVKQFGDVDLPMSALWANTSVPSSYWLCFSSSTSLSTLPLTVKPMTTQ